MKMHLVADVLDRLLTDKNGVHAGRVDGIIIEMRDDRPPRLAFVEVSPITMLSRFSERLALWFARIDQRFGKERGAPFRIPWERLARHDHTLRFDSAVESTPINAVEDWLKRHVVERIPGS
ncbi:MAG: hypothetical protein ABI625_25885 [bacterium]